MTSERIRPSEKTISWSSNPGLGNKAPSQSSAFHSHFSLSGWTWILGRRSYVHFPESPQAQHQAQHRAGSEHLPPETISQEGWDFLSGWYNLLYCLSCGLGLSVLAKTQDSSPLQKFLQPSRPRVNPWWRQAFSTPAPEPASRNTNLSVTAANSFSPLPTLFGCPPPPHLTLYSRQQQWWY